MAERKRYLLRIDPRLYDVLERWAADELRSVNAQIEMLLVEQARRAGRWPDRETAPRERRRRLDSGP
jgi:hypothetical protein